MRIIPTFYLIFLAFALTFSTPQASPNLRSTYKSIWRDYHQPLTKKQKANIEFIIDTLGNDSLLSIARKKSSIQKAGDQIANVHPLQFLGFIFSEEKLKAAIHNMNGRTWVWKEFLDGLKKSFELEANRNNLTHEQIEDFAERLNLDSNLILRLVSNKKWTDLVQVLIAQVPRDENATRYDI